MAKFSIWFDVTLSYEVEADDIEAAEKMSNETWEHLKVTPTFGHIELQDGGVEVMSEEK